MLPNKFNNKLPNLCPSVKGLGHKFGNLLLSPFTLATCAARSLCAPASSSIFRRHEGGSLCCRIPRLQHWLNESVSQLVAEHVSSAKALLFVCLFVHLSVCLFAHITRKPRSRTSPNSLSMAVARSSSDCVAIRYVHVVPVLWITLFFHFFM